MPTQVFVSVTPEVRDFLKKCRMKGAQDRAEDEAIDIDELYRYIDDHNKHGDSPVPIQEIMAKSEVVSRRHLSEEPLTELEQMRAESRERAYQASVKGCTPLHKVTRVESNKEPIRFATNFATMALVAFAGAFAFGYFFVENFVAPGRFEAKIIAGAFCSFFTLILESVLFVLRDQKKLMREAEEQKRVKQAKAARYRKAEVPATTASAKASGRLEAVGNDGKESPARLPTLAVDLDIDAGGFLRQDTGMEVAPSAEAEASQLEPKPHHEKKDD